MSRPVDDPAVIATDTNYNDPSYPGWHNTPTKVDPTTYQASGFLPDRSLAAQWLNHQLNRLQRWSVYFKEWADLLQYDDNAVDAPTMTISEWFRIYGEKLIEVKNIVEFVGGAGEGGRLIQRVNTAVLDSDANVSVDVSDGAVLLGPTGTLSTDRVWILENTHARAGDTITFVNRNPSYDVLVFFNEPSTEDTYVLHPAFSGTNCPVYDSVTLAYDGTRWDAINPRIKRVNNTRLVAANSDFSIRHGDFFIIPAAGGTDNWELLKDGARHGDVVEIVNTSTYDMGIEYASDLYTLAGRSGVTVESIKFVYDDAGAGTWYSLNGYYT